MQVESSPTKVSFLGHAGLFIEHKEVKILCDPWMSASGGFLSSWHQYPRNDHIDLSILRNATHLYVSHKHQDHFDSEFLDSLPKDISVLCPGHTSNFLAQKMRALGFSNVSVLGDWQTRDLSDDVKATMVLDPTRYMEDSAMVFDIEGFKILDQNDCKLNEELARRVSNMGIDIQFVQFSGAQYYPIIYEYGIEEKKQKIDLFVSSLRNTFKRKVTWISPRVVVPSAGPACFLDETLFHANFDAIFPDAVEFRDRLLPDMDVRYEIMTPGQTLLIPKMIKVGNMESVAYDDKVRYLSEYAKEREPAIRNYLDSIEKPSESLYEKLKLHIQNRCSKSAYLTAKINALVLFRITGAVPFNLFADFRSGEIVSFSDSSEDKPNYEITLDGKYLKLILDEKLSWEDFLLSMRLSLKRDPDVYNWPLFALLRFGYSQALLKIIEKISMDGLRETIVVESNNQKYEIQRFCPHSGEDLKKGLVENGTLTCARHHWCFDLNTGECISGGNLKLQTKKVIL